MQRGRFPHAPRKAIAAAAIALLGLSAAACSSGSGSSSAGGSSSGGNSAGASGKFTIALSNSFIGNPWRKGMIGGWTAVAQQAKSAGLISGYQVETTPQNTATAQIAQINNMILQHVNAIDIDPASPTALNPVIEKACKAGIMVVVFDSVASAPCEYNLTNSFTDYGTAVAQQVAQALKGKGNVIVAHGIVGTGSDTESTNASLAELKKYPGIKVVATINGGGSPDSTQSALAAVLPSLGQVDGVIDQTGTAGVFAAFQAARRPLPSAVFGSDGQSLQIWSQLVAKNAKYVGNAAQSDPGQGDAAFWESLALLQKKTFSGQSVPHNLTFPILTIDGTTLSQWQKVVPASGIGYYIWSQQEVLDGIADNIAGQPVPQPAPPSTPLQ
ncbi:MAG TPA: substrate-binding domain-containing protein [Trebonia sp.]|jgi:ribose transport system substrate-binding protein|nr:substrate-binding domain-containing protein [Trebonia sp.]